MRRAGCRTFRVLSGTAVLLAVLWGMGFAWFLRSALTLHPPPPYADGIVAFTGGAGRVEVALRLLAQGQARLLLISGVGGAAGLRDFGQLAGIDAPQLADRVTLGRSAASTRGNAAETAGWARQHDVRSLIVVTAGYHMPRALAELGRALPEVTLHPMSVLPQEGQDSGPSALRLLAGEYTKYLAAELGLTALDPRGLWHADAAALEHGG